MSDPPLLDIRNLITAFATDDGDVRAVDDVSFSLKRGETLGLVGESGCGKSVTALSAMRLLPKPSGRILNGEILFDGLDLAKIAPDDMAGIRGKRISMIFQEPMTALNPVHRIRSQLMEVFEQHFPEKSDAEMHAASLDLLDKVGIPEPEQRLGEYPHQISGGMRQRIMIAMALACKPDILIADEPTTALDVTIQAQILALIKSLQQETGMSVIFITHDLGVVAEICDTVVVMYAGRIAEIASVRELFRRPGHPYTRGLMAAIPRLETPRKSILNTIEGVVPGIESFPEGCRFQNRCPYVRSICQQNPPLVEISSGHFAACHFTDTLPPFALAEPGDASPSSRQAGDIREKTAESLTVKQLKMHFPVRGGIFLRQVGAVHAVDGVSFSIHAGKTLGLVGESGCGKTTLGRCILRLYEPTDGEVRFNEQDILRMKRDDLRNLRKDIQMIFQDPFESLNSRHTVRTILEEPFRIHGISSGEERRQRISGALTRVGLSASALDRFPHEFSGGQRQRIGIARAITLHPKLIVCDEPVSALDVSIRSQILNLLLDLQRKMGLTFLFISHDLTVVKHISDHVAVMYLGVIVEHTGADTIYRRPIHPYTQALLSAIPVPDPFRTRHRRLLEGEIPSPVNLPEGCRFHTRCPIRIDPCLTDPPPLRPVETTADGPHLVACHLADATLQRYRESA